MGVGPGKLPMFGALKNPKICPQIGNFSGLKSAKTERGYHVISQNGNLAHMLLLARLRILSPLNAQVAHK